MSVKEILKSLVDGDEIDTDKIGSGNFYWAFANKNFKIVLNKFVINLQFFKK